MTSRLRDLPLRRKLTLIMVFVSAISLLLARGGMAIYEVTHFRQSLVRELSTEAQIIAENSAAALAFADVRSARRILRALRAQPGIIEACLFTPDGEVFAEFKANDEKLPAIQKAPPGHVFKEDHLLVFEDVRFAGDVVGTIALRSDLRGQNEWIKASISTAGVTLLAALLVSLALSLRLQRIISAPVLKLAEVAHRVTTEKDYSLRAAPHSQDEIGLLTKEFNQMLAQIEKRDAALRESEGRFRQLADAIHEVFWLTDVDKNNVVYVSPGFETIWGHSIEELQKSPRLWLDCIHSQDRPRITDAANAKQISGEYDEEYRIIRPDGTVRWIHDRAFPVRDAQGKICRVAGIAEDITKRKQAEEALQLAEAKYRNIFENAIEGIFQTTVDGRYLTANPALARMLGFKSAEELVSSVSNLAEQICVDPGRRLELNKKLEKNGEVREFESQLYRKDGSRIWVSLNVRVVRNEDRNAPYYEGTCSDITKRKRVEEALRQSEAQYRQLVELAQEGIWAVDAAGHTTYANPHMAQMLGYTMDEMAGKHLFDFMDADGVEICKRNLERRKAGIAERHEFEFLRKDGNRIVAVMQVAPITDFAGNYAGAIACVSDITESRRAEQTLRRTEDLYRQAIIGAGAVPYARDYKTRDYLFMGEGIEKLIGYPLREVTGRIWEKIKQESVMLGEAAGLSIEEAGKRVVSGQIQMWQCDMRVTTRDGQSRWISDVSVQKRDEFGKLTGSMGILQDITERKNAEKRTSEFLLLASRLSAASTPEDAAASIFETATELIGWDCGFLHLYDRERDQITPILTFDLIDGQRKRIPFEWFKTPSPMTKWIVENGGVLVDHENRDSLPFALTPFGDKTRASTSMMYVPIRQSANVVGTISIQRYSQDSYRPEDLKLLQALADHCGAALQRIKATEDLLEAEAKYRTIFEGATEGIFQTTPSGKYLRGNPALARMFGYSSFDEMSACVRDIELQTYVLPHVRGELKRALEIQGEVRGFEAERVRRDGSRFWISINARAVRDSSGAILYYEGTTRDVTSRRRLERQLIEISDREQSRMGQDLHDGLCQHLVRTAFAANLLEKDLAIHGGAPVEQARKVSRLVDDAITQSRNLARGLYPVKLEIEGLSAVLEELAGNIRSVYNIHCDFEAAETVSICDYAIATHLYRIAQEAAINAAKHAAPKQIQIRLSLIREKVHLSISDDGKGLTGISPAGSGGMGLHIMNYRAGMIGASLKIEPRPGGGTIVSCIFEHVAESQKQSNSQLYGNHS